MDLKLDNNVILVTGGSKGIGKAISLNLLEEGAHVAVCARNEDTLQSFFNSVPCQLQSNLMIVRSDILDKNSMEQTIEKIIERFGKLDGIVANAGKGFSGKILDTPEKEWINQFNIKVCGLLNTIKPAIKELSKSACPRIVIMNGVTANVPDADMAAVRASRAAVKKVATMLAQSLAPQICVNTINLGVIDTERQADKYKKSQTSLTYSQWKKEEAVRREIPMKRMGNVEEVFPMVLLLLSPSLPIYPEQP